ncbi:peptidoglycan-recognition protein SC2 isoform X2 [Fopius arisanus]|uniref:Peptidoglycan-recognition protein n=1 Tax=Fopius arisanus TaxID=64838 RepID=A0A9R1UC33_9HYME|nr:PREDICTED: peptidoglycan-recognition protein SC2-like isoform X2 [Fopius arisanus]
MCNTFFLGGLLIAAVSSASVEDNGIKIINRMEWGGDPPINQTTPLSVVPPPYVIISHTAGELCSTQAKCSQGVRAIQTMHTAIFKWNDIAYNFLVGGDGNIYEGRGWEIEGAHTYNYNKKSIGISFIGTFNALAPSDQQLTAAKNLLEVGVNMGKLAEYYKLLGHRQLSETLSPGDELYKIIQTWPHWSEGP